MDCYADWCQPCIQSAPFVAEKNKKTNIPVIKVNTTYSEELVNTWGIKAMPTYLVIKGKWNTVVSELVIGAGKDKVDKIFDLAYKKLG